jgi:hypothetical protein
MWRLCCTQRRRYNGRHHDVTSSNPKNYDALQMHPMMQRQSKTLFGVLQRAEESG